MWKSREPKCYFFLHPKNDWDKCQKYEANIIKVNCCDN